MLPLLPNITQTQENLISGGIPWHVCCWSIKFQMIHHNSITKATLAYFLSYSADPKADHEPERGKGGRGKGGKGEGGKGGGASTLAIHVDQSTLAALYDKAHASLWNYIPVPDPKKRGKKYLFLIKSYLNTPKARPHPPTPPSPLPLPLIDFGEPEPYTDARLLCFTIFLLWCYVHVNHFWHKLAQSSSYMGHAQPRLLDSMMVRKPCGQVGRSRRILQSVRTHQWLLRIHAAAVFHIGTNRFVQLKFTILLKALRESAPLKDVVRNISWFSVVITTPELCKRSKEYIFLQFRTLMGDRRFTDPRLLLLVHWANWMKCPMQHTTGMLWAS